jgi:uncharacterized RDD family membrane protein YckC
MSAMAAPPSDLTVRRQGHYAGGASRLVAFATALLSYAWQIFTGHPIDVSSHKIIAGIILALWVFFYFSYQWATSGKTIGMAIFGLQVVSVDGSLASIRQACIRTLALPLSFLALGLGFLGIFTNRERRAWHDLIAKTAVVYSWDARAARLRWLARQGPGSVAPSVAKPPAALEPGEA